MLTKEEMDDVFEELSDQCPESKRDELERLRYEYVTGQLPQSHITAALSRLFSEELEQYEEEHPDEVDLDTGAEDELGTEEKPEEKEEEEKQAGSPSQDEADKDDPIRRLYPSMIDY